MGAVASHKQETQEIHNDTMQTFLHLMTAAGEFTPLHMFTPHEFVDQLKGENTYCHQERRVAAITAAWGHFSQRHSEWPLTAAPINKLTPTLTDGSQILSDRCCCHLEKQTRLIVYLSRRLSTTNARTKWQMANVTAQTPDI